MYYFQLIIFFKSNYCDSLLQPMRPLKATATTSQPVLTIQQIETIFYKIQDIFEIHKEFYDALSPSIQQWDEKVTVGHLFQKLVSLTWAQKLHCVGLLFFFPLTVIHGEHVNGCLKFNYKASYWSLITSLNLTACVRVTVCPEPVITWSVTCLQMIMVLTQLLPVDNVRVWLLCVY